jgi:hypothetical protein
MTPIHFAMTAYLSSPEMALIKVLFWEETKSWCIFFVCKSSFILVPEAIENTISNRKYQSEAFVQIREFAAEEDCGLVGKKKT